MENSKRTVWITRYALTKGLFQMTGELVQGKYFSGKTADGSIFTRDWTDSFAEAVKVAERMRRNKIASLKRSIARVEGIEFVEPTK